MTSFNTLIGETIKAIEIPGDDVLIFATESGRIFKMMHWQDCCEHVYLTDIPDNLDDLIGSPITVAEERFNSDAPPEDREYAPESYTWTFYELATNKGSATFRWFGESNGYYSEQADFRECVGGKRVW